MKNDMKGDTIVIKKDTLVSWLLSSILILSVIFMGSLFLKVIKYEQSYNDLSNLVGNSFSDTNLNVLITYPNEWLLSEIDTTDLIEVVKESSKGEVFNMRKHKLTKEVLSCMLVSQQTETGGFSKFVSVSFRGYNDLVGETLQKELEDRLKLEINATGSTEIEILQSRLEDEKTVYLEAKTVLEDRPLYYSQYTTTVGENLVTVLEGSTSMGFSSYDELKAIVDKLIIVEGTGNTNTLNPNSTGVTPQEPVTTDVLNPKGFQITR